MDSAISCSQPAFSVTYDLRCLADVLPISLASLDPPIIGGDRNQGRSHGISRTDGRLATENNRETCGLLERQLADCHLSSVCRNLKKGWIMKIQKVVFVLIGIILLSGTASAQQVKTDYDRTANFAQYKTYSWEQVKTKDPLDVDRIESAVNAALAAKGWTQVNSGGDVSIVAMEITRNQQTLNTFYDGFGGGWGWRRFGGGGFGEATTTTDTYKVGTVVVDLFDTKTKQLIWRGSSSDTLSNNSDKNIKNLANGVNKMFKHFPPDSSKK
jgi:hypothetical protein